ncbi:DNA glycosylase AlkZ-like family protein [Micromonospora chersina]|uniref:DNA glycosylase AlkZ-like family protein n=1 Tax=Micromonospora chersina TaxID=47854 RepID=UPI0036A91CE6
MRNTVHLVSARDALDWRALFHPLHAAGFATNFRRATEKVDRNLLLSQARPFLEHRPRTRAELGRLLARHWPNVDTNALGYARPTTSRCARCRRGACGAEPVRRPGRPSRAGWARPCAPRRWTNSSSAISAHSVRQASRTSRRGPG